MQASDPAIRLWLLEGVQHRAPGTPEVRAARAAVKRSERVRDLLSERRSDGTIPYHPYAKWYGAHWVLTTLVELGYPPGDRTLLPLLRQDLDWLDSDNYRKSLGKVKGQPRMHASIDGNTLWAAVRLGLREPRLALLRDRLLGYQWPDGGWNCDRGASGTTSSFTESLVPLRALALLGATRADAEAAAAARRAAEFFLKRRLYRRRSDGTLVRKGFDQLHFPCYWHYDILFGLTVMAEVGAIRDPRCGDALDLLESKRRSDGGFPAEGRYYRFSRRMVPSQRSLVDWGGVSRRRSNPFVTARALVALHAAGRA